MGRPTPALREMVLDLYADGASGRGIRAATGIRAARTVARILDTARKLGDPRSAPRKMRPKNATSRSFFVSLDPATHVDLTAAAEKRGYDIAELVCQLTEAIVRDKLIDSVLDDADEF